MVDEWNDGCGVLQYLNERSSENRHVRGRCITRITARRNMEEVGWNAIGIDWRIEWKKKGLCIVKNKRLIVQLGVTRPENAVERQLLSSLVRRK